MTHFACSIVAAARCWRDGQKKRCFTYRFLATGTVEEKIFQRQLSKEVRFTVVYVLKKIETKRSFKSHIVLCQLFSSIQGLQSVVDDKEQVNELSTKDLRNLFKLRVGTPSDTHDKLRCERCKIVDDNADQDAKKVLPKQLEACKDLIEVMSANDDATLFLSPLKPEDHGVSSEAYDQAVKQPMDIGTIKAKLNLDPSHSTSYKSASAFSKDVNRIFTNVMKLWEPGVEIADASRRLQSWWMEQWTALVPRLMNMSPDDDNDDTTPSDDDGINCAFVHNERGDNFQEQIGMPDEENMRHWSHHHSSDTVDDPVFRAAMRGFDTVSFVFGLEVTWSLIQQRQQEEEEKKALLELECMQEMMGDATEEPDKSCIDNDEPGQGLTCKTDKSIDDIVDKDGDAAGTPTTEATHFSYSENDSQIADESVEEHSDSPEAKESINEDKKEEVSSPLQNQIDESANDKKRDSPQSADKWSCSACTFENIISSRTCDMCGNKRHSQKKRKY